MDMNFWFDPNEKPLDRIVTDGGFCGIMRTIACIGDSLSSGEFESRDENGQLGWHDMFDYSWGQYLARMAGLKAYNFSRGGMTAKEYINSFAESMGYWNKDLAAQGYIIALGVNDILNCRWPVGSVDDICLEDYTQNKPTFAGYYGQIIQRYKEIQPDAKFFFVTFPKGESPALEDACAEHQAFLYKLTELFDNCYVIDLKEYGATYDAEFKQKFFVGGHMNAAGYLYTAQVIGSYIDYIIRHNMEDFSQIGFVGTPHKYIK